MDDSLQVADRNVADLVVRADVAVDAHTGAASISIPLVLTPGRGDIDPELALAYGSGGGNSPFGVGWSLAGVPAITLDLRDGVPRYDGDDAFAFAGERLVPWLERDGPRWVPRTATVGAFAVCFYRRAVEQDPRLRFERWIERSSGRSHWRVRDAGDVVTVYGLAEDGLGRVADPDHTDRVFAWLPESRHDPYGNAVAYVWVAEDVRGIDPVMGAERRHLDRAQPQRLLKRVRWANAAPLGPGEPLPDADGWSIELVVDYGDHGGETPAADPDRAWPVRADPYSTCRPGFEVRTWRLCRRLLLYHRFAELGPGPTLVWITALEHRADPSGSTLEQVVQTGVRRGGLLAGRRSLPPLRMRYTEPAVATRLEPVPAEALENAPGGLFGAGTQLVDLRGEGLPGILTETADAWYYKPNQGAGSFGPQQRLADKPARPAGLTLGDFNRDGNTDLMGLRGRLPGAASLDRATGEWEPFRAFRAAPRLDGAAGAAQWLDVDGDGRPEPVLRGGGRLTWYPPDGDGFAGPRQAPLPGAGTATAPVHEDPELGLFFADMNGDGLADQVRVTNGRVEYWPNLGNGSFGASVVMDGAPRFAPDDEFEPRRLRFVDLDGGGTTDLVWLGHGELTWWTNANGNRLVEGGRVTGLPYVDELTAVQVSDALGDGLPCLLWSSPLPGQAEPVRYLPLTGGVRPRLLTEVDNSVGSRTRLTYGSSASHYLRDLRGGRGWATRLPAHVVVVDRLEVTDEIAGTTAGSRYEYHDGFFDGPEQAFRGFAVVDRYDLAGDRDDEDTGTIMRGCTRTWFHTGDPAWHRSLDDAYTGDARAEPMPAATIAELGELTSDEHAGALRCLAGRRVREETFALEDGDVPAPNPFAVTQARWEVRRLQPARGTDRAAMACQVVERITHDYEQVLGDPRVAHWLALEIDPTGQVTLDCDLAYARRPSPAATAAGVPAQATPIATATRSSVLTIDTPERYEVGIPVESEEFELRLPGVGSEPVPHDTVRAVVEAALLAPLGPLEPFGLGTPQARRSGWERTRYWDDAATAELPLGQVGRRTLLHHEEAACFSDELVGDVFGGRVDAATMLPGLGYSAADGLWWGHEPTHHHDGSGGFYQLARTERWDGAVTTFGWALPHRLVQAEVVDAAGNRTVAEIDYHRLVPWRVTDANGAVREAAYDPLGVTVLSTTYGTVLDAGGAEADYGNESLAAYTLQPDASADRFLADPARFVQGAAEAVAYDLDAWERDRSPPRVVVLLRESLVNDGRGPALPGGRVRVTVSYFDGLGRMLQERVRVEPGEAVARGADGALLLDAGGVPLTAPSEERWLVSGRVAYGARQQPVRESEPYFSPTAAFEDDAPLARLGALRRLHWDALGRSLREDEPDGTYSLAEYLPWQIRRHDRNDTVADSRYRLERGGLPAADPARRALDGALGHAGTPASADLDPLGREVRTVEPTGDGDRVVATVLDPDGEPVEILDPRGVVALAFRRDLQGRVLQVRSADAGDCWLLPDTIDREAHRWDGRGVHVTRRFDRLDRPVGTVVDGALGLDNLVEELQYGDDPAVGQAAGRNLRGRLVRHRDEAGVVTVERYDPFGNVLRSERQVRADLDGEPDWRDPDEVALDSSVHISEAAWDALGRGVRALPPDGSVRTTEYLRGGGVARLRWALADGSGEERVLLDQMKLNARGQGTQAVLGNGVVVERRYDPDTFRTVGVTATFPASGGQPARVLQQLAYNYDPVGNVTRVADAAQEPTSPTPLLRGATVTTARDYTYDAVYQLRTATGRVHQALLEHDHRPGSEAGGGFRGTRRISLNDGQAVERYIERCSYDLAGNLTSVRHEGVTRSWTTELWVSATSNRSAPRRNLDGDPIPEAQLEAGFDPAGNCTRLPHLRELAWSYRGRIVRAVVVDRSATGGPSDSERYLYDGDGLRVRKVGERLVGGEVETTEKLYLDGCEIKRVRRGGQLLLERVTSQVDHAGARIALVHRWTVDLQRREVDAPQTRVHYPLHDHVGAAVLDLDEQGGVVTYEEFLPFGASAFLAGDRQLAARKDERYAGKERDDATGLYDFGYRSYASWIGRWLSPDPIGPVDALNLYLYVLNNPVSLSDPDGLQTRAREPAPSGEVFLGFVSQIPPLFRPEWDKLKKSDQAAVFEGRKTLYYDTKTEKFSLLSEGQLRARERQVRVGIVGLGKPPPGGGQRGPGRQPAGPQRRREPGPGATAAGRGRQPPPPPQAGGDGTDPGDQPAPPPTPPMEAEGRDAGTDPGGTGTGLAGEGGGAALWGEDEGGGGTSETSGFGIEPAGQALGVAGEGAGATGDDPDGGIGGERDQAGPPPTEENRPGEGEVERLDGDQGGVEGGRQGGVAGGTVGGAETGALDPSATVVPGLEGLDPNGSLDGARFGTRGGTAAGPGARPGSQSGQQREATHGGTRPTVLDRLTQVAGWANLEFRPKGGESGGVPGGFGSHNLGAAGQLSYLAVTVASFLVGAGELKALIKGIAKYGVKGVLKRALLQLRRVVPAAKGALSSLGGLFRRGAAAAAPSLAGKGTGSISGASIIRALRQSATREGYATAAAIKRGLVDMRLVKSLSGGAAGRQTFGTRIFHLALDRLKDARQAAGLAAHETKHVLQRLTQSTYHRGHELEAYMWQRIVDPRAQTWLPSPRAIWNFIKNSSLYKHVRNPPKSWRPHF